MVHLMLHSLQPSHGAVNFILAQLYIGVNREVISLEAGHFLDLGRSSLLV